MVVSNTVECPFCQRKYLLRQQVDHASKYGAPVRFGCKCGYQFKGEFTQKDNKGFIFKEKLSEAYEPNTDSTIAVCSDLPIGKELLYFPIQMGVFSPYLICGNTWRPADLRYFECKVVSLYDFLNNKIEDVKNLVSFLKSGDIPTIDRFVNLKFGDIINQPIQDINGVRTAILTILLVPFKMICSPAYNSKFTKPFKKNIIDVVNVIPKTDLLALNSELEKYYSLEQEFVRGITILINYLTKLRFLMPTLLLFYGDDFTKKYGDDFGISTTGYDEIKNLYSENFELLSRMSSFLFGISNLDESGNFNVFDPIIKCSSLKDYIESTNGIKKSKIEFHTFLSGYFLNTMDNQIRNGIGHFKTEYNVVEQKITYYPYIDPSKVHQSKSIYLIDFCFLINQQTMKVLESLIALNHFNKRII